MSSKDNYRLIKTENGELKKLPRVSHAIGLLAKFGLTDWSAKCAVEHIQKELTEHNKEGMVCVPQVELNSILEYAKKEHVSKLKNASETGVLVHRAISAFLKGESVYVPKEIEMPFKSFVQWHEDYSVIPIAVEYIVHTNPSDGMGYTGEVDAVVTMADKKGGKPTGKFKVVDFKVQPKIYREHGLQLSAYTKAYEETAKMELDGAGICRLSKEEVKYQWRKYKKDKLSILLEEFMKLVEIIHIRDKK